MRLFQLLLFIIFVSACVPSTKVKKKKTEAGSTGVYLSGVTQLDAGTFHVCALLSTGNIRCWGSGGRGKLGYGNTNNIGDDEGVSFDVNLGGTSVKQVSAGYLNTCVLFTSGDIRCWGDNSYGQLGLASTTDIGDDELPTQNVNLGGAKATQVETGGYATCALLTTGDVRCWGWGASGRLGLGNTQTIGDDEFPTTNINLGGATATQIALGDSHACALLTTGDVRCWGSNSGGQLGLGHTTVIGDDESPSTNVDLGGADVTQIATGSSNTCALLTSGDVRCWGWNSQGQLGLGTTLAIGDDEHPTGNANLGGETVTHISLGSQHACAVLSGGDVRCWGNGANGRLGLGNTNNIGDDEFPSQDVNLENLVVTQAASGNGFSCALFSNTQVRCWGSGANGQLGIKTPWSIGDNESPTEDVLQ